MLYEFDLTVPANTLAASPATADAVLQPGLIVHVSVQFPAGCSGMVDVVIRRAGHQVWPNVQDETFKGDDAIIPVQEEYLLDDEPFTFELRGWSPGTTFQHRITFRFNLLSFAADQGTRTPRGILARLSDLLLGRA